jgi:hypothetical protein
MQKRIYLLVELLILLVVLTIFGSCKKLVAIPPPVNSITTSQAFSTDEEATEAVEGIYYNMINSGASRLFGGGMDIYGGASADELLFFNEGNTSNVEFQENQLQSNNTTVYSDFWQAAYSVIYGCNSVISGIAASGSIHDSVRNELIGEAEFGRAFAYFYLVNLFGPVPLVTTINYNKTSLLARSGSSTIYEAILADLKDAQARMATDYSVARGQRIVPNRWAATALLARLYLYMGDWNDAAAQASSVITNTGLYSLVKSLDSIFLMNSTEAIWQLQQNIQAYPYNATPEGSLIIPTKSTSQPYLYLSPTLLNAFENGDNRRTIWVDSTIYAGKTYCFPFKYEIGPSQISSSSPYSEYYMVLRLAEQYLIRAEAEANGANGGLNMAIIDLDAIRSRAGLSDYAGPIEEDSVVQAIQHECQVELFGEWGNRWLDIKRWNSANSATNLLTKNKGISVSNTALFFPIPFPELLADPNLTQNLGYSN